MMWFRFLFVIGVLEASACGSSMLVGSGGSGGTGGVDGGSGGAGGAAGGPPGSVMFVLSAPPPGSFCDELSCNGGSAHLSITTADGQTVDLSGGSCGAMDCTSCRLLICPQVAIACPAAQGVPYTGGTWTWDGAYAGASTCGASHVTCSETKYAAPGHYVARFCATPGSVVQPDAGLPVCVPAGQPECTELPFDFPASTPVSITLATPAVGQP